MSGAASEEHGGHGDGCDRSEAHALPSKGDQAVLLVARRAGRRETRDEDLDAAEWKRDERRDRGERREVAVLPRPERAGAQRWKT